MPFEFYILIVFCLAGIVASVRRLHRPLGYPLLVGLATVLFWYVGDVLYNDYSAYASEFGEEGVARGFGQIVAFAVVAYLTTMWVGYSTERGRTSYSLAYSVLRNGFDHQREQELQILSKFIKLLLIVLLPLLLLRFGASSPKVLFPYLLGHPGPWLTTGIGGGFNSILAVATNLHMLLGALCGLLFVLARTKRTRIFSVILILLIWPHFLLDRTRGYIILITLPAFVVWFASRSRTHPVRTLALVVVAAFAIDFWFGVIIDARGLGVSVASYVISGEFLNTQRTVQEHQGLNMFEELLWINHLLDSGRLQIEYGMNYFANIVNPIPRDLWPQKPTIGLEYSIARGLGDPNNPAGVMATLSHGIVGQGLVNFGQLFGPVVAGMIFGSWLGFLATFRSHTWRPGDLAALSVGLAATFTVGRDMAILNLYPFLFFILIRPLVSLSSKRWDSESTRRDQPMRDPDQ